MAKEITGPTSSMHLSAEQLAERQWIAGRIYTLLCHYWREDDPVELTAAISQDWVDILEGTRRDILEKACLQYLRDEPRRRPTPGAILALARAATPRRPFVPTVVDEPKERVTKDQAKSILEEAGFKVNRFGGVE